MIEVYVFWTGVIVVGIAALWKFFIKTDTDTNTSYNDDCYNDDGPRDYEYDDDDETTSYEEEDERAKETAKRFDQHRAIIAKVEGLEAKVAAAIRAAEQEELDANKFVEEQKQRKEDRKVMAEMLDNQLPPGKFNNDYARCLLGIEIGFTNDSEED